jgi:hypothetical protein
MHIVYKPRDETLTIKIADGRIFKVTLRNGEAHVPDHVGKYNRSRIRHGRVGAQPETTMGADARAVFEPWCVEITPGHLKEKTE